MAQVWEEALPKRTAPLWLLLTLYAAVTWGSTTGAYERRVYTTTDCRDGGPELDGRLDEACWDKVEWATDFTQWEPDTGAPPSEQTAFKVLYDDHALYLAYRAFDTEPERIASLLERRDRFPGDWVEVNIDSYNDRRTAFSFTASVSGTRGDEFISQDGDNWDGNWDPVWQLATHIDEHGWTAEVMIPFSQLRFSNEPEQVWGLQVQRRLYRKEERSLWQPKAKEDPGWVSRFGELHGIRGISSGRQLELLPYASAQGERFPEVPGDPFRDGSKGKLAFGLDGKVGLTNDLTMDFTFNPDFGQVEADPSEINLTAFESYFSEKRPFFIEGRSIFDFQLAPSVAGGPFTSDNLFYSRRIGRRPQGFPNLADTEHAEIPDFTSIITAVKMSGKTQRGLSVGVLESVTAEEKATIDFSGRRREEVVEPLSNFFVGRVQQDLDAGNTVVGALVTAVNRDVHTPALAFMHRAAYTGGLDVLHQWGNKIWYTALNLSYSQVRGEPQALIDTQRSSVHYFQRPDNQQADFDPTRTSLGGHGGSWRLGRSTGGGWRFETGAAWRSPGFEINDIGFMRRADEINQFTWVGWASKNPFSIFRRVGINGNQWLNWDTGGHPLTQQVNTNFNANFRNNWQVGAGLTRLLDNISNTELRGGPSSRWPGEVSFNFWVNSDRRRNWTVDFGGYFEEGDENWSHFTEWWAGGSVRPTDAVRFSVEPFFDKNRKELQYIGTRTYSTATLDEPRYLFGSLDQETIGMTMRLEYTMTPNLTLQYYGSPFLSNGKYTQHKRITDPRAAEYRQRFSTFSDQEITFDEAKNEYRVDEDGGGPDYSFGNPDFNFRDFNSNLVLRWEFQPGSLVYLVWQQSRGEFTSHANSSVSDGLGGLFDIDPYNVFMIKVNKWFSL